MEDTRALKAKLLLILGLGLLVLVWQTLERGKLTVYCAHDSVFSEEVLRAFEKKTGIPVVIKFDTEATKSLGLVELIIRQAKNPRCDVLWNNELLGTLDLAERGLLEPYKGKGWERIPERHRDPEGRWAGFGARLRVTIHRSGIEWNNDALKEIVDQMDQRGIPRIGVEPRSPDFMRLAEGMGCLGRQAGSADELGQSIREALAADRPTVIELRQDSAWLG